MDWLGCITLDKLEFNAVPSDKALDAFFHCGGRLVVKLLEQVGVGIGHIRLADAVSVFRKI